MGTQPNQDVSCTGRGCAKPRARTWSVPDMTGDGKADVMVLTPDDMTLHLMKSEAGFTTSQTISIGTVGAIVL